MHITSIRTQSRMLVGVNESRSRVVKYGGIPIYTECMATLYRMLLNSTDELRGVKVGSIRMTNQHMNWGRKLRLVGENRNYIVAVRCTRREAWLGEYLNLERRGRIEETCQDANFPLVRGEVKTARRPLQLARLYMRSISAYSSFG
ncbi:hypothetical protein TNCV_2452041 [Trichonephila clavipes]|nr:hypothetical protein TNCV_2452041 [Trichonephila clavipes]